MKTVTVDHYRPYGAPRGDITDFWYRARRVSELSYGDIDAELIRLANRDGFTHWRSKQTGRTLKIKGA